MDNNGLKELIKECINEVKQEEYLEELVKGKEKYNHEFKAMKIILIVSLLICLIFETYLSIVNRITHLPSQFIPIICLIMLINSIGAMVILKYEIDKIESKIADL